MKIELRGLVIVTSQTTSWVASTGGCSEYHIPGDEPILLAKSFGGNPAIMCNDRTLTFVGPAAVVINADADLGILSVKPFSQESFLALITLAMSDPDVNAGVDRLSEQVETAMGKLRSDSDATKLILRLYAAPWSKIITEVADAVEDAHPDGGGQYLVAFLRGMK